MTAYTKAREEAMKRGWEIQERWHERSKGFEIRVQQVKSSRLVGSRFAYSPDEREYSRADFDDILAIRFMRMVDEADAELAKVA